MFLLLLLALLHACLQFVSGGDGRLTLGFERLQLLFVLLPELLDLLRSIALIRFNCRAGCAGLFFQFLSQLHQLRNGVVAFLDGGLARFF